MTVLAVDPSGSFNEGMGTTGLAVISIDQPKVVYHCAISAKDYKTQLEYWQGVVLTIEELAKQYASVVLSIEDYVLYANAASAQINSEMETSKLIGALTYISSIQWGLPVKLRNAGQVKKRWSNEILVYKNIIQKVSGRWCDMEGNPINHHALDAIRHGMHTVHFELKA